jgi:hypothetical protein
MSLGIDVDAVTGVLLADGWHEVDWRDGTRLVPHPERAMDSAHETCEVSTFMLDSYEYLDVDVFEHDMRKGRTNSSGVLLGGGNCEGVPSTGFGFREGCNCIFGPLTALLAVRTRGQDE